MPWVGCYIEGNADLLRLFLQSPPALERIHVSSILDLLSLSLSYCIRNRLISDRISVSSLIKKVTRPELGNIWRGNALPSFTNSLRMLIGKGRSANLPPCI